jgi:hypothetical protein
MLSDVLVALDPETPHEITRPFGRVPISTRAAGSRHGARVERACAVRLGSSALGINLSLETL